MEQRTPEGKAAKNRYIKQYRREKYEQVTFDVPKGGKAELKARAAEHGMSLKGYIMTSVDYYDETH